MIGTTFLSRLSHDADTVCAANLGRFRIVKISSPRSEVQLLDLQTKEGSAWNVSIYLGIVDFYENEPVRNKRPHQNFDGTELYRTYHRTGLGIRQYLPIISTLVV